MNIHEDFCILINIKFILEIGIWRLKMSIWKTKKKKIKIIWIGFFPQNRPVLSLKIGRFVQFTGWTAGSSSPIPVQSPSGLMTEPERWLVGGPTCQSSSVFKTMLKTNKSRHNVLTIKMKTSSQIHQQSNRPCHHGKCWT